MPTRSFLAMFCVVSFLIFPSFVFAKSGCCSSHDGVCGCKCCDGTALSATCRPYYPACTAPEPDPVVTTPAPVAPVVSSEPEPVETAVPADKVPVAPPRDTATPTPVATVDDTSGGSAIIGGAVLTGALGLGLYASKKKK